MCGKAHTPSMIACGFGNALPLKHIDKRLTIKSQAFVYKKQNKKWHIVRFNINAIII